MFEVGCSLMKSRWVVSCPDLQATGDMMRVHGVPELVARILVSRGVSVDRAASFLNPSLRTDFPDPFALKGMAELADDMAGWIEEGRTIAIFGDFDVDGATSSAVLCRFLRHFGLNPEIYIPDRLSEGYGPNAEALAKLKGGGAEIVVLCDCGATAFDVVETAKAMELCLVILDHHETEDRLPPADHLIDPKRHDDESGFDALAAVGVTFLTCVAVNNRLRARGFFEAKGMDEPPLRDWLDIVALGTVCDMVPLTGPNRLFVRAGLARMATTANAGIRALASAARLSGEITPYHCGFALGPRINAGSRVHRSDLGARLLCTDDPEEARNLAFTLEDCNDKRREIQSAMMAEATAMAEAAGQEGEPVIFVAGEDWHAGLAGLVAGRLKESYAKPAVVVTFVEKPDGTREGRGSGRSVPGINLAAAFIDARNEGLLVKGGGHAMAGGFTVLPEKMDEFRDFLRRHVARQAAAHEASVETEIDGIVSVQGLQAELVRMLERDLGPFGTGHPEPVFVLPQVRVCSADVVGDGHVRVLLSDWEGGARVKCIAFRAADTALGQALLKGRGGQFHVAGTLKINEWQGRETVEMHICDAAPAMIGPSAQAVPA